MEERASFISSSNFCGTKNRNAHYLKLSKYSQHHNLNHEHRSTHITNKSPEYTMPTGTTEAIYIPIDLEASLGKIEDAKMNDGDEMDCEPITRTSNNPFRTSSEGNSGQDQRFISPYPYSETDAEIKERQRLAESSVVESWSMAVDASSSPQQTEWKGVGLELIPNDGDDDFSISSDEEGSLHEEDLQFEKIDDPASFFESNVPTNGNPNVIPFSASFSSGCDLSRSS